MTTYKYCGWTFPPYRYGDMLAYVMCDHEDDFSEEWQAWFGKYLESLDMSSLWMEFVSDYLDEHSDDVHEKYKNEIQEIDDVPESCYDEDDELAPDYVKDGTEDDEE